jgi:hypothetical protein
MPDEPKFNLTLTGPQMDFIGKFTVDTLNAATAQARVASEIYQLLKAAVQPAMPKANGLSAVPSPIPEVEVDVSPRSPVP